MKYIAFYGNLYNCPVGRRQTTCPLYGFDSEPFETKFKWFEGLSVTEKDAVIDHHIQCVRERFSKNTD